MADESLTMKFFSAALCNMQRHIQILLRTACKLNFILQPSSIVLSIASSFITPSYFFTSAASRHPSHSALLHIATGCLFPFQNLTFIVP
jgi:hypothetical protein